MKLEEAIEITEKFILDEIRCEEDSLRMAELNDIIRQSKEALSIVLEAARKQLPKESNVPTATLSEEDKQGIARALSAGFDLKAVYELGKFNEDFGSFAKFKKAWTSQEE